MKINICRNSHTYVWGQHIPFNAWYGEDTQGWWMCTAHGKSEDGSLMLYRYNGTRWLKNLENSVTTRQICACAEKHGLWWTKVHWFKEEDRKTSLVAKQYAEEKRRANMLRHSCGHKKSGSGTRLDRENYYADKLIVDYECSNRPMHDFQRYYN